MSKFGKREALRFGWDAAIQYIGFFVVALLSMWVVSLLLNGIAGDLHRNTSMGVLAALFSALASLIGFLAHMGFIKIGLKIVHGHAPSREDFIPTARQFWTYLGAAIISVSSWASASFSLSSPASYLRLPCSSTRIS
jgi:hypothetical protein